MSPPGQLSRVGVWALLPVVLVHALAHLNLPHKHHEVVVIALLSPAASAAAMLGGLPLLRARCCRGVRSIWLNA